MTQELRNSQALTLDLSIKKGLCAAGAEAQLGKKLTWPPHKDYKDFLNPFT